MEEALNSALLGALGSFLRKIDEPPSTEDDPTRQLRKDLGSIKTKLVKLSEVHDPPPHTVSYWMKDAREYFYDMEDSMDQFVHANGADAETDNFKQLISRFKTGVDDLMERYSTYNLEYYVARETKNTPASHRLLPVVHGREPHPVVLFGLDGPANKILQLLKPKGDDREKQLKVVSIHGAEGVGKSTLAQKLWCELKDDDYKCRAFIQTAKTPDMRMILTNILSQIRPERPPENFQVSSLIQDIRKHLQDKRYFIVIDDLWTLSIWDVLRRAFPDSNCLSRIIIITTTENIALACCSYDPEYICTMKPMSGDHSKSLFIRTAFGSEDRCPQEVNDNLNEITRKCGGLPLALNCLAAVMAGLPETEQQLDYFKFLRSNLRSNLPAMEIMNQVLKLCYGCLPHYLKTCLLYLSVYPTSHIIMKEDLVKQWIAEGFICALDGKDVEQVSSCYFDELVYLNLIQRMDIGNPDKKRVSYRVHPVVHYFITCNSIKDNFITVIDHTRSTVVLTDKTRRLALHFGSATHATAPPKTGLSQVRSFAFMGFMSCMPSLKEFKLVRVIILHIHDVYAEVSRKKDDHGDTTFSLAEISKLFLLRYLQVRCNFTIILPNQVQCLQHLETLEINAVVVAVPLDIVNHPNLKYVCLGRKMKHTHLIMGSDTSGESVFLKLELLPPICSFSRLPVWVQQLHRLRILQIVVKEIYDPDFLSEFPFLTALSLYVRKPTARRSITFGAGMFPVLKYLKVVSGVLFLNFQEKAVCNLEKLKIGFNIHRGENFREMLGGIHHLLKLQVIVASIGADTGAEESDRIAAESALREAIGKNPGRPSLKVKRVEPFDKERNLSKIKIWSQEAESSNERICFPTVQKEIQGKDLSATEHPGILRRKLATEDSMCTTSPVPPDVAAGPGQSSAGAYQQPHMDIGIRSGPTAVRRETVLGVSLSSTMDSLLEHDGRVLQQLNPALLSKVHNDMESICDSPRSRRQEIEVCLSRGYIEWVDIKDKFNDCRMLALDIENFVDLSTHRFEANASSTHRGLRMIRY